MQKQFISEKIAKTKFAVFALIANVGGCFLLVRVE